MSLYEAEILDLNSFKNKIFLITIKAKNITSAKNALRRKFGKNNIDILSIYKVS